jgi:methyl-accepting chemotaxis protein
MTSSWTVGRRITVGFASLLVLLLVVSVVGVVALRRANDTYARAAHTERLIGDLARRAEASIEEENVAFLRFLLEPDAVFSTQRDTADVASRSALVQVRDSLASPSDRSRWDHAIALHERTLDASQAAMTARRTGHPDEARSIWRTQVVPLRAVLRDTMRAAAERLAADSRAAVTNARREVRQETGLFVGLVVLAGLGGTMAGVRLHQVVTRPLRDTATILSSSAAEILAATTQQASSSAQSAAAIAETLATVDEVVQTSEQAAQRARTVADSAQRAAEVTQAGKQAVEASVTAMTQVHQQVESIAERIAALSERAEAIGDITATVTDIAEQTHLLALNAAIEAARAGELGRGFSVVAGEVKSLAEQSKRATVEVRQILGDIQRAVSDSVRATERGTALVADGSRQVAAAGGTIRTLADVVDRSAQAAAQIAASAGQQAGGMSQIREAMASIHEALQQTVASTRQAEHTAADLNTLGGRLVTLVGGRGPLSRG